MNMAIEHTVTARFADKNLGANLRVENNYSITLDEESVVLRSSFDLVEGRRGHSTIDLSPEAFSYFVNVWNCYHKIKTKFEDSENEVES
jgi:hypothetical protein